MVLIVHFKILMCFNSVHEQANFHSGSPLGQEVEEIESEGLCPVPDDDWGRLRHLLNILPDNSEHWNRLFEALGLELTTIGKGNRFSDAKIFNYLRHEYAAGLGLSGKSGGEIDSGTVQLFVVANGFSGTYSDPEVHDRRWVSSLC